ncbi:energy-coupling factor transporter ATPase [Acetomicrobium sp. S15 = DSM 107314]|uniref:energy-coupling factor transporter ATPase n=1 Tax=Acetomicrobium sp. S15 = DSM 107314 TaxID=2529858 RepID=UPI0018E16F98|nr:energy-coupling factor transporter ATPase [Acetomicrobium sp. S15 = DSM 107314]
MAKEAICALKGVSFAYPGTSHFALSNIDLEIYRGEQVAIVGENGSGKSSLAKHLNALLQPTQGVCLICGLDTRDPERLFDIRRTVAMVFQNPDNQIVAAVVEEDVAFGPENLGLPPEEISERVDWALDVTGLSELRRRPTYALSGGQKQRLAIAGALAMNPEVLVLDEATSMLDPSGREELLALFSTLRDRGMTLVQITHRTEEILDCDRVLILGGGCLVWNGTPIELFLEPDRLFEWGLDVPDVVLFWHKLMVCGLIERTVPPSPLEVVESLCR